MISRSITVRSGITLLEVLTAIFIMGIGMMALLTLFPAGALSMARAVRDDRAAAIAANAAAIAAAFDLRNDSEVKTAFDDASRASYMPDYSKAVGASSNPVFVDPLAPRDLSVPPPPEPNRVDPTGPQPVQRIYPSFATTLQRQLRYFTLQDEITFDTLGNPKGGIPYRPGTYSFAYMLRRPINSLADVVNMSVLIYSMRVTDYVDGETSWLANGTQQLTTLTVSGAPDIRRRSWVFDISADSNRIINGDFYRVENVTDMGGAVQLELDRPLRLNCSRIVHFRDLIAVIDRGSSW